MIKLYYPEFWQKRNILSYILLPLGLVFLILGFIRKKISEQIRFNAFTICVGNCTIGGTGKTQLIISLAKELSKKNINFIILSKGYGGNCTAPALVTSSSSPSEVGDEALELCKYGNSFVVPNIRDAGSIISKYNPDVILVDDGMQNPHFKKDIVIMTIDGERGFGNGFPIPAGPMRALQSASVNISDIIIVNGELKKPIESIETKPIFNARIKANHNFGNHKYFAFAGIGNPQKFFDMIKNNGGNLARTKIFPDHYKYTKQDIEKLYLQAKESGLRLITTRKDYVKIKNLDYQEEKGMQTALSYLGPSENKSISQMPELDLLEVELEIEEKKDFFDIILTKYNYYMKQKR